MSTHPEVLWAQRSSDSAPEKNIVYLTMNLSDIDKGTLKYKLCTCKDELYYLAAGNLPHDSFWIVWLDVNMNRR
ncbi:hypothetical protein K503DRAFT_867154 [Rhizopogon vinicolor AM-OR11-026]|uniref:Uncharacterized protein n=1 Tax=Rhizopogon vinicolor AM-OR11-026 TaxID=1314800 RepID=A0A1B7MWP5_9AGAM|nr:hypothetical protein K503DRAFT_867154 [Rhizopogon vinicolor AM-OR11-026]